MEARGDIAAVNAGALIYLSDKAESIAKGILRALHSMHSGKALEKLKEWVRSQNRDT